MITNLKLLQVQTFMAKVSLLKSDKNCQIKSLPSRQRFDTYVAGYILAKVWQSCKKFGRQVAKVRSVIERIDHIYIRDSGSTGTVFQVGKLAIFLICLTHPEAKDPH